MIGETSPAFAVSYALLWGLVVIQTLMLLGLVSGVRHLQRGNPTSNGLTGSPEGELAIGETVPNFVIIDTAGEQFDSSSLLGRVTALLFVSTNCHSCLTTLAELKVLQHKAADNVVVVCGGTREECGKLTDAYGFDLRIVADERQELGRQFRIPSVPRAVLIGPDNRIVSYGRPGRGADLEELLRDAASKTDVATLQQLPVVGRPGASV